MNINTHSHMPPLGWLPLSEAARKNGFHPVHRRLVRDGHDSIDKWGYLNPDIQWRQGRGKAERALESAYTLELLRSSAETALCHAAPYDTPRYSCESSPERLLSQIPDFESIAQAWKCRNPSAINLISPTLPICSGTRSEWLATLPQLIPLQYQSRLDFLMRDPALLLRVGYQMLCREWAAHGQNRHQTAEALAIIGLGALGLFPRVRCLVCYRLAMPGTTRCALHSQTQSTRVHPKIHAHISSESRLAKRVMAKLGWARNDFSMGIGYDGFNEEKTIAGLLWGLHVGNGGYTLQQLKEGFDAGYFPRVRALLPINFCKLDEVRACAYLRKFIDPGEWVVSYWYSRIGAAEAWLNAAETLSSVPSHMKPTDQNRERVAKARAMLQQGISKMDIASQLGISQSHLSHLLSRH